MANIVWDEKALQKACTQQKGTLDALDAVAKKIASSANSLSSGFRTEVVRDYETGQTVGGTQPRYESSSKKGSHGPIAIVYPANYSAMKDNHLHNTLLKAR